MKSRIGFQRLSDHFHWRLLDGWGLIRRFVIFAVGPSAVSSSNLESYFPWSRYCKHWGTCVIFAWSASTATFGMASGSGVFVSPIFWTALISFSRVTGGTSRLLSCVGSVLTVGSVCRENSPHYVRLPVQVGR